MEAKHPTDDTGFCTGPVLSTDAAPPPLVVIFRLNFHLPAVLFQTDQPNIQHFRCWEAFSWIYRP